MSNLFLQPPKIDRVACLESTIIAYALFFGAGTYGIKAIMFGLGMKSFEETASFLFYLIWGLLIIKYANYKKDFVIRVLTGEFLFILCMVISYFCFPLTQEFYEEYFMFLRQIVVVYIPAGVILKKFCSFDIFFQKAIYLSWFGSIFLFISFLLGYMDIYDYQYWGVHLSPLFLIAYTHYMITKSTWSISLSIFDGLLILLGGRQSLFVVLLSIFLIFLIKENSRIKILIASLCIGISILICIYIFSDLLIDMMIDFFSFLNLDSRNLLLLANGEMFSTYTRAYIYESAISAVLSNGICINGFFADRYLIRWYGSWIAYPHNIILEILLDFGFVIGGSLVFYLLAASTKSFFVGIKERRYLAVILSSISIIRLFVSSSYLIEGSLYMYIGLLLNKPKD